MATIALLVISTLATWIWNGLVLPERSVLELTIGSVHAPSRTSTHTSSCRVRVRAVGVLRFTKLGLAMRAGALNPAAARLLGMRTSVLLALGWAAASLGAVSGMMIAPGISISAGLRPSMMQSVLVCAFAARPCSAGSSPVGAVVATLALGVGLQPPRRVRQLRQARLPTARAGGAARRVARTARGLLGR